MAENKEYEIEIGGVLHTVLLSDEDAKARGAKPRATPKAGSAANKSRQAENKGT